MKCRTCEDTGYDEIGGYTISCRECEKGYEIETQRLKSKAEYHKKCAKDLYLIVEKRLNTAKVP